MTKGLDWIEACRPPSGRGDSDDNAHRMARLATTSLGGQDFGTGSART